MECASRHRVACRGKVKKRGKSGNKKEKETGPRGGCHVGRLPYLTRHVPLFLATSSENRDPRSINVKQIETYVMETSPALLFLLFSSVFSQKEKTVERERTREREDWKPFDRARLIDSCTDRKLWSFHGLLSQLLFRCRGCSGCVSVSQVDRCTDRNA